MNVSTPELFVSSINGVEYIPGGVSPDLIVSSLVASVNVSTPELFVSSINGVEYIPGVPSNLVVSTLRAPEGISTNELFVDRVTSTDFLSTPQLFVSSINGSEYPALILSTLVTSSFVSTIDLQVSTINGQDVVRPVVSSLNIGSVNPALGTDFEAGLHLNSQMYFQGNSASNINEGVMMLRRTTGFYTDPNSNTFPALTVDALSTLGATLPVICATIYLNGNNPTGSVVTPITGDSAGNIILPFSSIVGISTINGAAYPAPAFVSPDLIVSTLTADISISTPSLFISSINGALYPPPGVTTPSTIVNGAAFIDIDGTGNIITSTNGSHIAILSTGDVNIYSPASTITIGTGSTIFTIDSKSPISVPSTGLYYNQNGIDAELYLNSLPIIPPPSAWYSTTTVAQPIYSTFSTLITMVVFPKYTSTFSVSATVNWHNDGGSSQGDDLEFRIGVSGLLPTGGVTQTITSHVANGYQATTLLYTGFENFLGFLPITVDAKKPITNHGYTIQSVVLNTMTDLYD